MKSIVLIFIKSLILFFLLSIFIYSIVLNFTIQEIFIFSLKNSLFITLCLTLTHLLCCIKIGEKTNFSISQTKTLKNKLNSTEIYETMENLKNFKFLKKTENNIIYESKFHSLRSFGEIISFSLNKKETEIKSESKFKITIFDFGQNLINLKKVISIF